MSSPITERTRRHRERERIKLALAVAERLRALPDVAGVAQVLVTLRASKLESLKTQLDMMECSRRRERAVLR